VNFLIKKNMKKIVSHVILLCTNGFWEYVTEVEMEDGKVV